MLSQNVDGTEWKKEDTYFSERSTRYSERNEISSCSPGVDVVGWSVSTRAPVEDCTVGEEAKAGVAGREVLLYMSDWKYPNNLTCHRNIIATT